ncbi:MAG: hypothetical protein ABIS06_03295 [Vicinamibacterales bacterium]
MKRNPTLTSVSPALLLCLVLAGCEATKSESPLSPSVAGPLAGVEISAPKTLEPAQGFKFKENQQPIKLLIENSSTNGVRPVSYTFEVASDEGFTSKVFARSGVAQGDGGRSSVTVERLDLGRGYYWRVRADDGANNSTFATSSFEVLPKALLNPPSLQSPANGSTVPSKRPQLVIGASERNAAVGGVSYEFQVSANAGFTAIVAAGLRGEAGASTGFVPDGDLVSGTTHYWRVRATDFETTSGWSGAQSFKTPSTPAPSPSPGPANPGGPCNSSNPDTIIKCERNKYGRMSSSQLVDFLRASAQSLNRNGIGGGPWGILRKTGGSNCNGYSCDIICAGQGSGQRQVDVLGDAEGAQTANWGAASTVPNIRVDVCEIQ